MSYNPSNGTVSNKSYSPAQGVPTDGRTYFYDTTSFISRPFKNVAEVLAFFPNSINRIGHTSIIVNNGGTFNTGISGFGAFTGGTFDEYWFKDGTADGNLVLKSVGALATVATSGSFTDLINKPIVPSQFNPTAGANITITGTYPNLLFTASVTGGGGGTVTTISAVNNAGQTWTILNPTTTPSLSLALTGDAITQDNLHRFVSDTEKGIWNSKQAAGDYATNTNLATKQATLVSGTNIKTIGGQSLLGSGDIPVSTTIVQMTSSETFVNVSNSGTDIWIICDPSTTLASYEIIFPSTPTVNEKVLISFGGTITTGDVVTSLTTTTVTGQAVIQPSSPTSIQAGDAISYRYSQSNSKWYRIN